MVNLGSQAQQDVIFKVNPTFHFFTFTGVSIQAMIFINTSSTFDFLVLASTGHKEKHKNISSDKSWVSFECSGYHSDPEMIRRIRFKG